MSSGYARENPFTPSFGQVPLHPAGRDILVSRFAAALERTRRSPELTTLVSGARGTGKTSLLSMVSDEAQQRGWVSVDVVAEPGMLEDIYIQALRNSRHIANRVGADARLTGVGIGRLFSVEWEPGGEEPSNWRSRMEDLIDELNGQGLGLLITVDEVDPSVEEFVHLASTYQLFVRSGRKVGLFMAGLPYCIEKAKERIRISSMRRANHVLLSRIDDSEVERTMRLTIEGAGKEIPDSALSAAVEAAGGFPFMIQLVGYRMWEESGDRPSITADDVERGVDAARRELRSYVLESTYRELSDGDLAFLRAMLPDSGLSTMPDIAARMGKTASYASVYRERLLLKGIIGEADRGKYSFDLPDFKEFLAERLG